MPTYEYECGKCGKVFEAFQSMTEPPLDVCQLCGAKGAVSRRIGAGAGLIFKGSGFYVTDYKRAGTAGTESPAAKKNESKSETTKTKDKKESASSTDSKPKSDAK
jgi:putative FmdB family regulatory protein